MNDNIFILYNIDKIVNDENVEIYIIKYLNIINLLDLFSYQFKLKISVFIILLHNLS